MDVNRLACCLTQNKHSINLSGGCLIILQLPLHTGRYRRPVPSPKYICHIIYCYHKLVFWEASIVSAFEMQYIGRWGRQARRGGRIYSVEDRSYCLLQLMPSLVTMKLGKTKFKMESRIPQTLNRYTNTERC